MFELLSAVWPLFVAAGGILIALLWGASKKRQGREAERDRARAAREAAATEAEKTRAKVGTKPVAKQREDLRKWER